MPSPSGPDDADSAGPPTPAARDRAATRAVYDEIAAHFAETRAHPWPEVVDFVESAAAVDRGLDVGCGNGRHAALLAERAREVIGVDVSRELLLAARDRAREGEWAVELAQADAAVLPLAAGTIDLAVYVATLHHLPTREARVQSLDELARVLAPGGRALVSAWSTAHDRFGPDPDAEEGFDTTVDWTLPDGETVPRFYHIYAPAEFEADLRASDLTLEAAFVSSGNCYAEVRG
jgi:ubiquinone/menaquinone biosynthesis C-methylase UbiE